MKKTYILSCAAIIISIISMTISIIEMGTEAVTTPIAITCRIKGKYGCTIKK